MSFAPGGNVGAYRIIEQLGSGGMATVYKAYHAALDRYVAIKVLHAAFKGDVSFLARFQREARVVARLEHPNIVPVYDFSEHEGSPYLVMRFVEGETLKARLSRGQQTLPEILDVIRPMGDALTYAHQQGVLHRDIKPSNVLLTDSGQVFLTDFGLARIVQAGESSLTRDAMVGTPYYISPEQAVGKSELDARTDIYSFGVVLYELLTGRVPFQADTPFAVVHDHIYTPLPMPSSINPDLPPALERMLMKALAKEPDDRYATALELVTAVEEAVTGQAALPPARAAVTPAPTPPRAAVDPAAEVSSPVRTPSVASTAEPTAAPLSPAIQRRGDRRPWLLVLGGGALLALVAIIAIVLLAGGTGDEPQAEAVERPGLEQPAVDLPPIDEPPIGQDLPAFLESVVQMAIEGDVDGLLTRVENAAAGSPDQRALYLETAHVLVQEGHLEPAIMVLRQGVIINQDEAALRLDLARALVAADRWDEALGEFEWLLERAPRMAEPHAYLSVHLSINVGDLDAAHHQANQALRLNPESAEAHLAMGVFHWKTQDFMQARLELDRALHSPYVSPLLRQRIEFFLERIDQADSSSP